MEKSIEISIYKEEQIDLWNEFVARSINGTFLFNRNFMDYHSHLFTDHSLMVFRDSELVCLLPAHQINNSLYSHNGLTYGGLLYSEKLTLKDLASSFKHILEFLEKKQIERLFFKSIPHIYYNKLDLSLDYLLSLLGARKYRTDILSVLKVGKKNYSRDRKSGYKRGIKNNLVVRETEDLSQFWNEILIPNLNTKYQSAPVHTLEEIATLKSRFKNQIRQFNVYSNKDLVAGTTIFETKNVARSQYMSSNSSKNKLGSLDFLHVHLLEDVFKTKKYFDFGASNINSGKQVNEGLLYWKSGFGTSICTHDFYEIETKEHRALDMVFI